MAMGYSDAFLSQNLQYVALSKIVEWSRRSHGTYMDSNPNFGLNPMLFCRPSGHSTFQLQLLNTQYMGPFEADSSSFVYPLLKLGALRAHSSGPAAGPLATSTEEQQIRSSRPSRLSQPLPRNYYASLQASQTR
jgi:hypothetical protein